MMELKQIENRIIKLRDLQDIVFSVYDITGYDFSENLKMPDNTNIGVYIFTRRRALTSNVHLNNNLQRYEQEHSFLHELLYCGKTSEIDARFYKHNHQNDLIGKANCICIHICETESEIDTIEKQLLTSHNFKFNEVMNGWSSTEEVVVEEP